MRYLLPILMIFNFTYSQSDVPVTLRAQFNGSFGYTIIGNTLNELDNSEVPAPPCQLLTQSSASLNLQPNQSIVAAYLYWGGIGDGTFDTTIQLNGIPYNSTQTFVSDPENNGVFSYFNSYRDITSQILSSSNGIYTFSNLDLNPITPNYCSNFIYNAGWHIVVVYSEAGIPNTQLNIYDGNNIVNFFFNNGVTSIPINNLGVISTQNAKMSYVALNGSSSLFFNESITFNGNLLSNALNPSNNPFNSSNTFIGSTNNWNQDIDTFDISPFIAVGQTQANITMTSLFTRYIQTVVTSIRSALPDATATINSVTGQETCGNRDLVVTCTISNSNSNATLPTIPVAFYANNTLLTVQNTVLPLAIGDSSTFSVPVTIPNNIPNTFNLKIVADDNGSNFSSVAESNENNNEATQVITLLEDTKTPTFNIQNSFCQGDTVPTLPLVSLNNISGTWSPSVISNQNGGTYVFTPNVTQCISNYTLDVTVQSLPTFDETVFICEDENGNAVFPVTLSTDINDGSFTFAWFKNSIPILNTQSSLLVFEAGNYQAIASPIVSGCNNIFNFQVDPVQPLVIEVLAPPTDFASNQTISVNASGGSGQYQYSFDGLPFQNNSVFTVRDGGTISVIVKDVNGCYTYAENVEVWNYPRFFTPNNDGYNDTWGITTQKQITVEIFDQYGKILKKLTNNERWDGIVNKQIVASTGYWFVIYYDNSKSFRSHFSSKR